MSKNEKRRIKRGTANLLLALDTLILFLSLFAAPIVGDHSNVWKMVSVVTAVLFVALAAKCIKNYAKMFVRILK